MKKTDFFYDLPEKLIAQHPLEQRDSSKMMVIERQTGEIKHMIFSDIISLLNPGDALILNDTRVLPARLFATKTDTGAVVEFLLLKQLGKDTWEVLARPGKRAKPGTQFIFEGGELKACVSDVLDDGNRIIEFSYEGNFYNILERIGEMPLPPYITEKLEDKERYQTVYSRQSGSAAAPTAGLHFTPELLSKAREKGVGIGFVTLHVGLGTFRPVKTDNIEDHLMHSEHYQIPAETAQLINQTKKNGGRVIAVGTTCCRTLESVYQAKGEMCEYEDDTSIFIYPGYEFRCIDALITNFHLPESTLIMLVSAFCSYENTMNAYKTAVENEYRFFSFGDAMFII